MGHKEQIISDLRELRARDFVSEHIFDRVPHVFSNDRISFLAWKDRLAQGIEVDPACITLVGTSAVGVSLNPSKFFKEFDEGSDIDVAVITPYHFTVAWRFLRTQGHRRLHVDAKTRTVWDEHVRRYIYWGTVATDKLLGILPFGRQWLSAITEMTRMSPTIGRDIKLRVYSDYESLRSYQIMSAQAAREGLFANGDTNASIP